jgi:hypothetical protein
VIGCSDEARGQFAPSWAIWRQRKIEAPPNGRWLTNPTTESDIGTASIGVILEELCASGHPRSGERVLCVVPESARVSFACLLLSVA